MSDNQKYYYMRLKEDFFNDDAMRVLEASPDGYLYSNILLKMYLASLKTDGRLMLNNIIPYNSNMIAAITGHQVGTVEKALQIFEDLGLIEMLDNGAIYMLNIQNFIGKTSTEADRKREYERRIAREKMQAICEESPIKVGEISEKSTPENRDRDRTRDKDRNIKEGKSRKKFAPPSLEEVKSYCEERQNNVDPQYFVYFYESKGWMVGKNKMKDWKAAVRTWERRENESSRQDNRPEELDKPKKFTDGPIQQYLDAGGVVPEFEGF